jgi:aquaporin Z
VIRHRGRVDTVDAPCQDCPAASKKGCRNLKKYLAEFIGTFFLVFMDTGAVVVNEWQKGSVSSVGISLTFGLIVMAIIYAIGDLSGAHINPAVTIAFWYAKRIDGKLVAPYIGSQVLGALAGSVILLILFGNLAHLGATIPAGSWWQSFVLEVILTCLLMFVVLCVSTGAKEKGIMAGAAIGAVVALEALFAGPVSGASMNPARSLAPALVSGQIDEVWIYLLAPVLGALLGVIAFHAIQDGDPLPEPDSKKS